MPTSPAALISEVEQVMPAAPMSCMPTTAVVLDNSRVASRSNFSWNGSPTCTEGKSSALSSVMSLDANDAPWMPSLPVADPTMYTGLPGPAAVAEMILSASKMPTDIALTRGFTW